MKIITHSGNFHVDDVFAVATLLLLNPEAEVIRSRKQDVIESGDVVVDVGGEYEPSTLRFDHHQPEGAGKRENGIPYASFGLIWKEYGPRLTNKEAADIIEQKLVLPIDAIDNGVDISTPLFEHVRPYTLHDFFYSFVDENDMSEAKLLEVFLHVVTISKELLMREIKKAESFVKGREEVKEILQDNKEKHILILDKRLPWSEVVDSASDVFYVVYPRVEGNWGVKAVRKREGSFELRKPFPESWAGKSGEELRRLSGVPDALFAHRGQFLLAAESQEGALTLARLALTS